MLGTSIVLISALFRAVFLLISRRMGVVAAFTSELLSLSDLLLLSFGCKTVILRPQAQRHQHNAYLS